MGSVYKRGGIYWIKYYGGSSTPIRESAKTDSITEAKRYLKIREGDYAKKVVHPYQGGALTFENLIADYIQDQRLNDRKALENVEQRIKKNILPYFGHLNPFNITPVVLRNYVERRSVDEGASNGTIRRELGIVRRVFNLALENGVIPFAPKIKAPKDSAPRSDFYTDKQQKDLLKHLPDYVKSIVLFAAWTGWRRGEILSLRWSNVDFDRGHIRIIPGDSKSGKPRTFPMTKGLRKLLKDQKRKAVKSSNPECPWVFHRDGERILDFRKPWYRALKAVGLDDKTFHAWRRTATMNFERAGISDRVAMELMGHSTRRMHDLYRQVSSPEMLEAVKKLEQTGTMHRHNAKGKNP